MSTYPSRPTRCLQSFIHGSPRVGPFLWMIVRKNRSRSTGPSSATNSSVWNTASEYALSMGKASSKKSEDRFPPRGISRFAVVVKRSGFRRRGLARLDHCQIHSAFRQSAKRKASSGVIEGRARRDTKLYIPVLDAVGERRFFRLKEGSPRYNPYSRTP